MTDKITIPKKELIIELIELLIELSVISVLVIIITIRVYAGNS